ncbi:hypothetical protein [Synechococcus sp. CCY 9618]|uniref:hypothetical protein n=1 Tax=Synechococcus sp. CCY 9618 TaxID=2815602 RepID=UPI001C22B8CC|nr:hypothetical protein [Synechococcus sp. CCY 9618]
MASIDLPAMVTVRPPSPPGNAPPRGQAPRAAARPGWDWRVWWIVGLCFGLGYSVSHRLLNLGTEEAKGASQRFDVQPFPGTRLDSLRQRFGGEARDIRGDLDLIELEQQQKQDAAEIEKRRAELEAREARERQRQLEGDDGPIEADRAPSSPAIETETPSAPALPPIRTPPAREREAAGPAPAAPPPLVAPPAPGVQP